MLIRERFRSNSGFRSNIKHKSECCCLRLDTVSSKSETSNEFENVALAKSFALEVVSYGWGKESQALLLEEDLHYSNSS